mgnify:CR=1 FL=1
MYPEDKRISDCFKLIPQTAIGSEDGEEDIPNQDDETFQLDEYFYDHS